MRSFTMSMMAHKTWPIHVLFLQHATDTVGGGTSGPACDCGRNATVCTSRGEAGKGSMASVWSVLTP